MNLHSISLYNKLKINAIIEFMLWERRILLLLIDFIILITSLFLYYKSENIYLNFLDFITYKKAGIIYGITLYWFLSVLFNLYNLEFLNKTRKILPLSLFIGFLFSILFILTPILTPHIPNHRINILGFVFGFTFLLTFWRVLYTRVFHANLFLKKIIVLISNNYDKTFITQLKKSIEGSNYQNGYRVQRIYRISNDSIENDNLARTLNKITSQKLVDNIIIIDTNHEKISKKLNSVLITAIKYGINVQTYLKLYEEIKEALPLNIAGKQFYSIFPISQYNSNYIYSIWYRSIDVVSALIGLVFAAILTPIILFINIFVNRGPVFYSQNRVGKGGKEFIITKFRSMVVDAEKLGAKMSIKGDIRITPFGKVLRKTRIDELPQFWAVLKGDMSLIGPRPERKIFIDELSKNISFYNARHLVRPGITGWAQVKYPYGENLEDSYNKLEYDLYYIKNRSITLDIRIIFKTINTIIFSKGQ